MLIMNKESNIFKNIISVLMALIILGLVASTANATQAPVNLGTAGNFVILAKSGISTTGTTSIVGDIGVSPIDSTAITGFGLILDSTNKFSTSSIVTGKVYASDYTSPTPSIMTNAISDMETAYTDAAGRTKPTATEMGAGNIGGMTITPGLYKWGTGVTIPPGGVTLSGGANDVWIFQIAQDLIVDNGAKVILNGGAQAKNIFWQVAGQTTIGTTSDFKGIILSKTMISLNTGATLNGRALAQTAVTLDSNSVTMPTSSVPIQQVCDYAAPPQGCRYVNGPNYNSTTHCGMVLSCPTPMPTTVTSTNTGVVTGTPAKTTVTATPVPSPTNKVPGFELMLAAVALCSVYLFSRNRR